MKKNCKICGADFDARGTSLTCSVECRKENNRKSMLKHDKKRAAAKSAYDRYRLRDEAVRQRRAETYRAWYAANKEKKDAYDKAWKQLNQDKVAARNKKKRSDPVFRLSNNVRRAVHDALKTQSSNKNCRSHDYLGCTGREFAEYLVHHYAWKSWFTLENYGTVWHVDHVRPLASFDLSDHGEAKSAFHYTNCQPLSASENISKNSNWGGQRHYHEK